MFIQPTRSLAVNHFLLAVLVSGSVFVVTPVRGEEVNEDHKIAASDGTTGAEFGNSVSIDNGVVAIGAPFADDNGTNSGAAYLFDASSGVLLAKLLPSDGAAGAEFGISISISNGIVAVGAIGDDENGANAGAAYLFDASTGTQLAKLLPNDGAIGDEFGNSIAIDNGIVAVGSWRADEYGEDSGSAYLFDASTGNQLDKLLPDMGNNYQTFGVSIAIDAGTVAIGARTFFVLNEGYTFARVYLFNVSSGNQLNVLQADIENYNGDQGGQFGDCVDIHNGLVAVGAPARNIFFDHSGAAYVFDASTGEQLQFIYPADGHDRDNFGNSISIDNGIVVVGAHQDGDKGFSSGSAYLYNAFTGTEINKILASDGAELDLFGSSISINGGVTVVGAKRDDDNGEDSGSAYVYYSGPSGIEDKISNLSEKYTINQNYPNPFNPVTSIRFHIPKSLKVKLEIYDSVGRLVSEVINEQIASGEHTVKFNAHNFSSGVYYYKIRAGDFIKTRKMFLLK